MALFIETVFADTIRPWRDVLARTAAHGNLATFDNDFCRQRGLEVDRGRTTSGTDLSYLVPLLLS
jgi:hypothetical protein